MLADCKSVALVFLPSLIASELEGLKISASFAPAATFELLRAGSGEHGGVATKSRAWRIRVNAAGVQAKSRQH